MARKLRIIAQGYTHHCYGQCHGRRNLLLGSFGKRIFIEAIQMCQLKYEFELIAAEIVSNHIHLLIRTLCGHENISRIMQYINARIAEKYNRAMGETGAFWNARFGSTVIEEADDPEQYLLWLLWYIGYNPVRKKLSYDPRKNQIGFINAYLARDFQLPILITCHNFFLRLGSTFEECVKRFLLYEDAYRKRLAIYFK